MYIGELIKKYREKHGLSMQDFANLSGISKAYIGVLEKVYNPATHEPVAPSLPKMQAIASAMDMKLTDLLELLNDKQPAVVNVSKPFQRLNEDEKQVLNEYRKLNEAGKIIVIGFIETLTKQDQFII